MLINTETYYTTQTFTRTVEGEPTPITSYEVITEVIITESPSVTRTSVTPTASISPMLVTKTYLTTFTYYKTGVTDQITNVQTDTVVSSEIVTETIFITPEPTLLMTGVSKTSVPSFDSNVDDMVYATRTFYTTSTHLTTLLEGGNTVTTSSVDVQSRIVTETFPASELLGFSDTATSLITPSAVNEYVPQTEAYIHVEGDIYEKLKTYFATYTHYTTMLDGSVNSREVTNTNIGTSTVTTSSVPQSLIVEPSKTTGKDELKSTDSDYLNEDGADFALIRPTAVSSTLLSSSAGSIKPSLAASPSLSSSQSSGSSGVLRRPSSSIGGNQGMPSSIHGSKSSQIRPSSTFGFSPSQLSSLKASIITSNKTPGASVVQLDPSELFATENTKGLHSESTLVGSTVAQSDNFASHTLISTSKLEEPTVLRVAGGSSTTVNIGETVAVVERNGQRTVIPGVPSVFKPSRPTLAEIEITTEGNAASGLSQDTGSGLSMGSGAAIGLMVPVLSAVAGMIRNNMAGVAGVAAVAKSDRQEGPIDFPRNTLIRMEEPHFIPVGGVAASIRNSRRESISPSQGFIPLNRFSERNFKPSIAPFLRPIQEIGGSSRGGGFSRLTNVDIHGSFRPPSTTERGFTAIFTTGVIPTHVSVISGVETILFGDGIPKILPPPGLPAPPGGEFKLIHSSLHEPSEDINRPIPQPSLMDSDFATAELPFGINSKIDDFPSERFAASNMSPKTIVAVEGGKNVVKTQVIEAIAMTPEILLQSTVGVGSDFNGNSRGNDGDFFVVDKKITTVINGVSTVMSGATTIFGSPFTRPSGALNDDTKTPVTTVVTEANNIFTNLFSMIEENAKTTTMTATNVKTVEGIASTFTNIMEHTLPQKIMVSTVIGKETQVNIVSATTLPSIVTFNGFSDDDAHILSVTTDSNFNANPNMDDVPLFAEHNDVDSLQHNEASLGLAEENEISRVIDSQNVGQEVDVGGPVPVSACRPRCSEENNEVCKLQIAGHHTCVCRPGYARLNENNLCARE